MWPWDDQVGPGETLAQQQESWSLLQVSVTPLPKGTSLGSGNLGALGP